MFDILWNLFFLSGLLVARSAGLRTVIRINDHTSDIIANEVECYSPLKYLGLENPEKLPWKRCFYVDVPEDYEDANSPRLKLYVAQERISRSNQTERVFIPPSGGPAGSSPEDWNRESMFLGQDMILLDPRGVGHSTPFIWCDQALLTDECIRDWSNKGHDLEAYNTLNNARDLEAIRLVFGYSKVSLYGFYYGAITSMMYMREYPNQVQTAFLNGIPFPGIKKSVSWEMQTAVAKRVLEKCQVNKGSSRAVCNHLLQPIEKFSKMLNYILTVDHEKHDHGKQLEVMKKLRGVLWPRLRHQSPLPLFITTILEKDVDKMSLEALGILLDHFPSSHLTELREHAKKFNSPKMEHTYSKMIDPSTQVNMTMYALMQLTDGWENISESTNKYPPYELFEESEAQDKQSLLKRQDWTLGGEWKVNVPVVFIKSRYDAMNPMEGVDPWLRHFDGQRMKVVEDSTLSDHTEFNCVFQYMSNVLRDQSEFDEPPSCFEKTGPFKFDHAISWGRTGPSRYAGYDCFVPDKSYLKRRFFWRLKYTNYSHSLESELTETAFDKIWNFEDIQQEVEEYRREGVCRMPRLLVQTVVGESRSVKSNERRPKRKRYWWD